MADSASMATAVVPRGLMPTKGYPPHLTMASNARISLNGACVFRVAVADT